MTPSQEIIERYSRVEREPDAFGRVIGVRRLRVSQQTKVAEMTPGLEGFKDVTVPAQAATEGDPERGVEAREAQPEQVVAIARRTEMMVAASVCEIDGVSIPFAKTRGELDSIADRLDEEGIVAAMVAYARLAKTSTDGGIAEAKK